MDKQIFFHAFDGQLTCLGIEDETSVRDGEFVILSPLVHRLLDRLPTGFRLQSTFVKRILRVDNES